MCPPPINLSIFKNEILRFHSFLLALIRGPVEIRPYASWLMCHVCECHDHANAILDVLPNKREPSQECRAAWTST